MEKIALSWKLYFIYTHHNRYEEKHENLVMIVATQKHKSLFIACNLIVLGQTFQLLIYSFASENF